MPITRDTTKPQHDLGDFHYGELPIEGLPTANNVGDVLIFTGTGWRFAEFTGGVGINIDYSVETGFIEISLAAFKINDTFTGDGILKATLAGTFTGDSVLLGTLSGTFTADAVLV